MKKLIDWLKNNWVVVITIVAYVVLLYLAITTPQQKWPILISGGITVALIGIMVVIGILKKNK